MESIFKLETEYKNSKTVVSDIFFTSPFKIAKPFYDKDEMKIVIMTATPGILENDHYNITFTIGNNSNVHITGQSFTKIFKMKDGMASQKIHAKIKSGAILKYIPCPSILFEDSNFKNTAVFDLEKGASFVYSDIISCGRVGMNEIFKFKKYNSRTQVNYDNKIIFLDNNYLQPNNMSVEDIGFYEGYTHQGLLYIFNQNIEYNSIMNSNILGTKNIEIGITHSEKGLVIRTLAMSAQIITSFYENCIKFLLVK